VTNRLIEHSPKASQLKRALKIFKWVIISLLLLVVALWFVLKIPAVQNWVGQKIATRISKTLNTKVTIDNVSFSLFNNLELNGLLIEDQRRDTLLYAGTATVRITDWFFMKDKAELKYVALENTYVKMERKDSVWNYQFIADELGGGGKSGGSKKGGLELNLKHLALKNIVFKKYDAWYGQNTTALLSKGDLTADEINFNARRISGGVFILEHPEYYIRNYARLKPPSNSSNDDNDTQPDTSKGLKWNGAGWNVQFKELRIKNGLFANDKPTDRPPLDYFDGRHVLFTAIDASFKDLLWQGDTIRASLNLKTKERSGLEVTALNAAVKLFPNTLEFNKLSLTTPHSTIGDYLSFSFKNFNDDISDFMHRIKMNGRFVNTKVSGKDLAIFAPKLASWNRDFLLNGTARGTVDNLSCANIDVRSNGTTLRGNLVLTGLPDIRETFIDLNNGYVATNYNDLLTFAPSLRNVRGARLQELGATTYKGNFTGFINDFVTYGTLQTALGTVETDLNLKLAQGVEPAYSGKLFTDRFQLGRLLQNRNIGQIGFNGKIAGTGFKPERVKADINGTVTRFDYGTYSYTNITAKGRLENLRFNGDIIAADPNLDATVSGLIDLSGKQPHFDVVADITKADFKKLQFIREDYTLSGNVKLAFTGSNLNNFGGEARLLNATITKDGSKLPIDSLTLSSRSFGTQKELRVNSNEFEGRVTGQFQYQDLGNAAMLFLNRYYPSIFKAPKTFSRNQDFDFEVHTKNVSDLVGLVSKDIRGLNGSHITGRISTAQNIAAFRANIPYFSFKNYQFDQFVMNGDGTLEDLKVDGTLGTLRVNDSLEFYATRINMVTNKGESQFTLRSASNNTLNDLDISGKLESLPGGIRALFNPSSFTVNGRQWKMESNGELLLQGKVVHAENMRFVHNDEEILLESNPGIENNDYQLNAKLTNINLGDFAPLFLRNNKLAGRMNGTITINDPLGNPTIETINTTVDHTLLDNDSIGRLTIGGNYNIKNGNIGFTVASANPKYNFDSEGTVKLKDVDGMNFRVKTKLKGSDVDIAKRFLNTIFKEINGNAVGEIEIYGNAKKQMFLGQVETTDTLRMTVGFTNVKYKIPRAKIDFRPGEIYFADQNLYDMEGNDARIAKGRISHDGFFKNMGFDIDIRTDTLILMDTKRSNSNTFFGFAKGDARLRLTGNTNNMLMDVTVDNPVKANMELITGGTGRTLGKADFVEFRTLGREMENIKTITATNLTVNVRVNANPNAEMKVVLDELAGDNILANGNGIIDFGYNSRGGITLNGKYIVEKGKYDFSFRSWIKKPFDINKNSTITWTGDPYNAIIDISASYKASKVNLTDFRKDLFALDNNSSTVGDLKVTADLTKNLTKPDIKFKIEYDETSKISRSELLENILRLLENDPNETNRQVAFLVLFNRLIPYDASRNNTNNNLLSTGINTISGFVAAQATTYLNQLLQNIFPDGKLKANVDFSVYQPGGLTAQSVGGNSRGTGRIELSRSLFDERLTIYFTSNLDFGLGANQTGTVNFALLPNFLVEYKLRRNGSVVATVFHRQVLDILQADADRKRLSTGAGINWRKESETLGGLFSNKRRKKTAPSPSIPAPADSLPKTPHVPPPTPDTIIMMPPRKDSL
jgi:hypothetical protein